MHQRLFPTTLTTIGLALAFSLTSAAQGTGDGPKVGQWKTYILASGGEITVPAPPAEDSAKTRAELDQLRLYQALRSPLLLQAVNHWNSVPVTQRWIERALALNAQERMNPIRGIRVISYVTAAMHDAVVASWHAKYTHNRRAPSALASDLTVVANVIPEPSYPSEHAAVAAAAAGTLAAFFPKETDNLAVLVREAGLSRCLAGANYPSDVEAGLALGQAVAKKAAARMASDGSDVPYTGTPPTGPGFWTGTNPVEPAAGSWKPWFIPSVSELRPPAPPGPDTPEFKAALDEVKRINANPTSSERAVGVFWASGGPFNEVTHALIARDRLSPPQAVRVWAAVAAGQYDAALVDWEAKYTYWTWRPNQADPTIVPFLVTPNYPSYPSGLSGAAGVTGDLLAYFFPQDAVRVLYMQREAATARVYSGVHYRYDCEAGLAVGHRIGELAIQRDRMNVNR
jgi:membrane-associated phospholipid phosphatase